MVWVDDFFRNPRAQEERLRRFGEFVQKEKAQNSPGMPKACLQSEGMGDFYGPVVFEHGMHNHLWKFFDSDNPKAVVYEKEEEAVAYSQRLLGQLRMFGYLNSKVWVEQVALCMSIPHPYSSFIQPDIFIEPGKRYIIRMNVK